MAPFNEAVAVHAATDAQADGSRRVYEGTLDPTWNIGNVPCGGYALALILQACIQHQANTNTIDPLHISSHFLKPTDSSVPFKIYVHILKPGKSFSNLVAELHQEGILRITAHAIFGTNAPPTDTDTWPDLTLKPPSSYARRHPLTIHPSEGKRHPIRSIWGFHNHIAWAYDDKLISHNDVDHPSRTNTATVGGGGLEWGGWLIFEKPSERLSNAYIPFLVDMFINTVKLLPGSEVGSIGTSWFPTMTLAVDFKFPISQLTPEKHSMRTAGLYSLGRFLNNPQGRHDIYVEVWSAPSNIGEGTPGVGSWRDEQICLATATQMALTVPIAQNIKNGQQKNKSDTNTPRL